MNFDPYSINCFEKSFPNGFIIFEFARRWQRRAHVLRSKLILTAFPIPRYFACRRGANHHISVTDTNIKT